MNIREKSDRKKENPRITMSFYGDNLDYLRKIAWVRGCSVSAYINHLIVQDRGKNETELNEILATIEEFNQK